ncbi:hypothetical protein HMPREF9073_01134 [Capnocytophaga sp. oral taxon 326 str. F0382]|nr:hypothetical protein HMPREF9073_01134 [Capnocytophaga sp. oral taxon 326 str. F0382]
MEIMFYICDDVFHSDFFIKGVWHTPLHNILQKLFQVTYSLLASLFP